MSDTTYFNIEATGSTGDNSCGPCLKVIRREYEARIAALRSLVESLEEVKTEQKARIEQDGERMEAARCALHTGNARCTGEGKQEAIIAALDAIGWEAPDA